MLNVSHPWAARFSLALLCAGMLLLPGCRGCSSSPTAAQKAAEEKEEAERKKKAEEEKKKKQPMQVEPLRPYPSVADQPVLYLKPGHWTTLSQEMVRNYDNWVGQAEQTVVDRRGQPVAIPRTRFSLRSQRPLALSKGQPKQVASVVFPPALTDAPSVQWRVTGRESIVDTLQDTALTTGLLPHQYNLLVLAANPASYGRLKSLRSIDAPLSFMQEDVQELPGYLAARKQYRVLTPELGERAPVPDSLTKLTSFAYILWDEVNPELFEPAQRDALLDWLHWGGQLIISGPDSMALLKESFLAPYLPATAGDAWQLSQQNLQPLANRYGVGRRGPKLSLTRPWSGIRLKVVEDDSVRHRSDRPTAQATRQLNTGALFAERRVGRGRVMVSALRLNSRAFQNWQNGYECVVNAVLLRRPARRFLPPGGSQANEQGFFEESIPVTWTDRNQPSIDASVNSQLRLLTRDTYDSPEAWQYKSRVSPNQPGFDTANLKTLSPPSYPAGVGGWDDFNAVSSAARAALRESAGVKVPGAGFVIGCVSAYLFLLGPVNWLIFRILGRVEFAWAAAPVIAIAGAMVVVKQAQLDIGFVRAQTEIALLETQPNYPRGHLTRFTGMYTSLGTTYQFTFDDPHAVAAPFALREDFSLLTGQNTNEVIYDYQDKVRLRGLTINSNSTEMVHSEEMHAAGGVVRFGTSPAGLLQIENPTPYALRHVAVVYRPREEAQQDAPATLTGCWIGDLPSKGSAVLNWARVMSTGEQLPYAEQRAEAPSERATEELNLEPLWKIALNANHFEPGEYRCLARIDQSLPGVTVQPVAAQQTGATLLVAHLQYDLPPAPQPDANAPVDVQAKN